MLNLTDTEGRTVWVAGNKHEFGPHISEFRERGEKYRIVERTLSALGGSTLVYVLVLLKGEK
jgi:hypothetical protein